MFEESLYPKSFVSECRGPKFQNEAGYFREAVDITTHCATFGDIHERHDEYPTATSLTNRNSDKTITLRCPQTESSRISGSDIIKPTYSMNYLENFLRMPMSLFELADRIRDIPSPRKRLFQLVVTISGLAPNTVKMILSPSSSGIYPREHICERVAAFMKMDINRLFPADRQQSGSIIDIYSHLPKKNIEYLRFVNLLCEATHSRRKTVKKWLKARRVPRSSAQYAIAQVIGVSISQLFPLSEENQNAPV